MQYLQTLKKNRLFRFISNRYVLIFIVFAIWMLFSDTNSYMNHIEYNREIEALKKDIEFYKKEIVANKEMIKALQDPKQLEKYAREVYKMKKENETLFLIEYDTIE
ncbi:MAG: FtsB family cell division protein [Flavicella sp.]